MVGWYGFVGVQALRSESAFELESTPGNVALIAGLEVTGMLGGATVACHIWGDEKRLFPTANSVILGGAIGAAALILPTFWALGQGDVDSDTDNPLASGLALTGAAALGLVGGGYLGYRLDRSVRGSPAIAPVVDRDSAGVVLSLRF